MGCQGPWARRVRPTVVRRAWGAAQGGERAQKRGTPQGARARQRPARPRRGPMDSVPLSDAIVEALGAGFVRALRTAWPTLWGTSVDGMEQQLQLLGSRVLGRVVEHTVGALAAAPRPVPPPCPHCE